MTLYEQILSLPLFQGLSNNDLNEIVTHTKFDFSKVEPNIAIVKEDTPCSHLCFLLGGTAICHHHADNNSYSVEEEVFAPNMFDIDRLFGLTQYYSYTVTAKTRCSILILTKEEIMKLSDNLIVFRMNLYNRMATDVQKLARIAWHQQPMSLVGKMLRFFSLHVSRPAGHKVFYITMQTLASEIHESRLNVSVKLNEWHKLGLITTNRGRIDIPRLEDLLKLTE